MKELSSLQIERLKYEPKLPESLSKGINQLELKQGQATEAVRDKEQIQELLEECTYEGTTQKGVCGILITSKTNGNSIFMPAGGYRSLFSNYINQHGVYWSSSLNTNYSDRAYNLVSSLENTSLYNNYKRYYGSLIRPVMSKK